MPDFQPTRREFCTAALGAAAALSSGLTATAVDQPSFRLHYTLASAMYGTTALAEILPEASKIGATTIDLWPRVHGNQREQVDEMGLDPFADILEQHNVRLGSITRYDFGPYRLQDEMRVLKQLGGRLVVTGARNAKGDTLRDRVQAFVETLRPHVELAEELGVVIGIENHANSLIHSVDSIKHFADFATSPSLGIALAPYHLPQEPALIADLIGHLDESLVFFQAWEHGQGCHKKLPKEEELLQMPGRGNLDFVPIVAALKQIGYHGSTEIFMHPVPRGIPILETTDAVTHEINRARKYLETCCKNL